MNSQTSRKTNEMPDCTKRRLRVQKTGVLTGADIQNIRSAGLHGLAGILMLGDGTCWEARFKTVPCLLV